MPLRPFLPVNPWPLFLTMFLPLLLMPLNLLLLLLLILLVIKFLLLLLLLMPLLILLLLLLLPPLLLLRLPGLRRPGPRLSWAASGLCQLLGRKPLDALSPLHKSRLSACNASIVH